MNNKDEKFLIEVLKDRVKSWEDYCVMIETATIKIGGHNVPEVRKKIFEAKRILKFLEKEP